MSTLKVDKDKVEATKKLEKTFQDPFKNRLNLRCQRDRPRIRKFKVA